MKPRAKRAGDHLAGAAFFAAVALIGSLAWPITTPASSRTSTVSSPDLSPARRVLYAQVRNDHDEAIWRSTVDRSSPSTLKTTLTRRASGARLRSVTCAHTRCPGPASFSSSTGSFCFTSEVSVRRSTWSEGVVAEADAPGRAAAEAEAIVGAALDGALVAIAALVAIGAGAGAASSHASRSSAAEANSAVGFFTARVR